MQIARVCQLFSPDSPQGQAASSCKFSSKYSGSMESGE